MRALTMQKLGWAFLVLLAATTVRGGRPNGPLVRKDPVKQADLDAFRAYLEKNYPGKTWATGPEPITSPEIRAAYGAQRFYYVFSLRPAYGKGQRPSDAEVKQLVRAQEEYTQKYVSFTVRIDDNGKVTPLRNVDDFQHGLIKITTEDEAKTAAAAMLSLQNTGEICPEAIAANRIVAFKLAGGGTNLWVDNNWQVALDAAGKLTGVPSKNRKGLR